MGPAVWLERHDVVALPRFANVRAALSSHEIFSSASGVAVADGTNLIMGESILTSDPPLHEILRRPMAAQLSPASLSDVADDIKRRAEAIVADVVARRRFDGVTDVARPYSLGVVSHLLGLPADGREQALPQLAEGAFNLIGPPNDRQAAGVADLMKLASYAAEVATEGALRPGSRGAALVEAGRAGEIVTYAWPGIDTTINGMASALWLFAVHPEQWDRVRADPSLIPGAWNEVLRMHAPVHTFTRLTTRAVDVDGVELPAQTRVLLMYGSANRDERRFPDPDLFDVARNPTAQLAFGRGIHLCVGIHLARMEAHALLETMSRSVERFDLTGVARWMVNNSIHGLATLPLEVSPA